MSIIIEEHDLYVMLISELRYAIRRDNHLAPGTCVDLIYKYLPLMPEPLRSYTAKQLAEESIQERIFMLPIGNDDYKIYSYGTDNKKQLENDSTWEELLVFLLNYLTELPYDIERYMRYLYGHMDYYIKPHKGIDWCSEEIKNKLAANKERALKEKIEKCSKNVNNY